MVDRLDDTRWQALITYRTEPDKKNIELLFRFDEFDELGEQIEEGPHWDTIVEIKILKVGYSLVENLTIEKAAVYMLMPGRELDAIIAEDRNRVSTQEAETEDGDAVSEMFNEVPRLNPIAGSAEKA
jgi:hypothetical protein